MEKRALLAVILSLLVLVGYQYLFAPEPPKIVESRISLPDAHGKGAEAVREAAGVQQAVQEVKKAQEPISAIPEKDIHVETDTVRVVFTTKGASVKSWALKKYKDKSDGGRSLELVPPKKELLRLVSLENESPMPDNLSYVPDKESLSGPGSVTFTAVRPDGVKVTKTFTFLKDGYRAVVRVSYENSASIAVTERSALSLSMVSREEDRNLLNHELAYLSGKELTRVPTGKFKEGKIGSGGIEWAFLGDKYFITAVLPAKGVDTELHSKKVGGELYEAYVVSRPLQIKPGESRAEEFGVYFGPKEVDFLKAAGSRLERAIDLGFFDLVAYPVLLSLKWTYNVIPNYGVVIILLTVIIKIAFFPLSQKSYKSMKEMQKIAPLMEQLREKYKDDKERLNREIMELYRRYKVNPLGGCLPMILQIPVFFALYTVLNGAVELRHAPFILWVTDLSAKDPYYVTPVLMGVTMFIQQKMTPSSADPAQQKVMMLMPVIFTFMFLNFSSGLVIYWLINNVLSIGQQYYVNKYMK